MTVKLEAALIEHIHDVLVSVFLPFDEKINPAEYRSQALIESAAARPFQTAFGAEVWPELAQKAAALFHSMACNHCFINGNKRTAVIALDLFLAMNDHILTMTSDEVYEMSKATANANQEGRDIEEVMIDLAQRIGASAVSFDTFKDPQILEQLGATGYQKLMTHVHRMRSFIKRLMDLTKAEGHSADGQT